MSNMLEGGLALYTRQAGLTAAASGLPWKAARARNIMRASAVLTTLLLTSACDLSPDYSLPDMFSGALFKEDAPAEVKPGAVEKTPEDAPELKPAGDISWKRVDEKAKIEEFAWWRMFGDATLDGLEEQAMQENPSLDVAAQRVASARAQAGISASELYPKVSLGAGPQRQQPAAANINGSFASPVPIETKPFTTYTAQGTITYELDLFGMNRNTMRAAARTADAEENNYRAARLALQSDIAQAYFQYAALKTEQDLLTRTLTARKNALSLTRQKRDVGTVDDLTLSSAETDFATVDAERAAVTQQLEATEHALATLVGVTPAQLALKEAKLTSAPPVIPSGLPSTLLERRPDVQSAASLIAAANARIGAARAGYFPNISLSAVGGVSSNEVGDLFKTGNKFWSVGPLNGATMLVQPIFEGGRLSATLEERKASYEGSVASYRASVLQAFREVEDQLSGLRNLRDQAHARNAAYTASKRAYTVAKERYDVGYSSHLDYLDAERNFLAAERTNVQVLGQRYVTTVQLVKALGGSWQVAEPATDNRSATPATATRQR